MTLGNTRSLCRTCTIATLVAGICYVAVPAKAQSDQAEETVEPGLYDWGAAAPEQQLRRDQTRVPDGSGAVFVTTLTRAADEPAVALLNGHGEQVASGPTGRRIAVPPGEYRLVVGSGTVEQSFETAVTVRADETSVVEPEWGALRVEVVSSNLVPHRGEYELIRMDTREVVGSGSGADSLQGERLRTWLLPPGLYRVVRVGGSFRSRVDYATVDVPAAGVVRFRLVMDEDTGQFLGAGVLFPGEQASFGEDEENGRIGIVAGASGSFSQSSHVIGLDDQLTLNGNLFVEGSAIWTSEWHFLSARLNLNEGMTFIQPASGAAFPLIKSDDEASLDVLYTFMLLGWLGPYVRAAATTQLLPSHALFSEDQEIRRIDADGTETTLNLSANETFQTSNSFAPTVLRFGGGLNARLFNQRRITLSARGGVGLRMYLFDETYTMDDDPQTEALEFREVSSDTLLGFEAAIRATARLTGWLSYTTELEYFSEFSADFLRPNLEWNNTLTIRLSEYLSLIYNADIVRLPQLSDRTQLRHSALLRFAVTVL